VTLPICDPIIPDAPLVVSQSICEGEKIAPLIAYTSSNATVDWYLQETGGLPVLSGALQFIPAKEGVYYAQSRLTDCKSLSRTQARLQIKKAICPVINSRKIRR
jgi:hypothetical protein